MTGPARPAVEGGEFTSTLKANETVLEIDHPVAGRLRQAQPAPRFSSTPTSFRLPAPLLGADSHQILGHIGLSDEEIEQLADDGVTSLGHPKDDGQ